MLLLNLSTGGVGVAENGSRRSKRDRDGEYGPTNLLRDGGKMELVGYGPTVNFLCPFLVWRRGGKRSICLEGWGVGKRMSSLELGRGLIVGKSRHVGEREEEGRLSTAPLSADAD